jgi:glycerate 2-kinase
MVNVLIASDSFKGTFSSREISEFIELAVREVLSDAKIEIVPMADGGEGTIEAVSDALKGKIVVKNVVGPLSNLVSAKYAYVADKKLAIIEMAEAAGLSLVPESERSPLFTTTFGVGQLISDAIDKGAKEIIMGVGGSATNDAGTGMAQALGFKFYGCNGENISKEGKMCGKLLERVISFDDKEVSSKLRGVKFLVACDVTNKLYGKDGAAYVYASQKGASKKDIKVLDNGLRNIAAVIDPKKADISSSGAAGGLGYGLMTFCNAKLEKGVNIVGDIIGLEKYIKKADIVITGEGKLDGQSMNDKTPVGVAKIAKKHGKKVIAIVGKVGAGYEKTYKYFDVIKSITNKKFDKNVMLQNTPKLIKHAVVKALKGM